MANVKVTSLTELSTEQLDQFTWFLASHRTDDEQTSNKVNFASLSTHLCADLSIYEMQDAIKDATGGQSERIAQLTADVRALSGKVEVLSTEYANKSDLDGKQDKLIAAENIKTINGQSILGQGDLPIAVNGGGPTEYLKMASKTDDGNTLYITNQAGTVLTFSPSTGGSGEPIDYNIVRSNANNSYSAITGTINPTLGNLKTDVKALKDLSIDFAQVTFSTDLASISPKSFATYNVTNDIISNSKLTVLEQLKVKKADNSEITDGSVILVGNYNKTGSFACVLYNSTDATQQAKVTGKINGIV